jgi:hypothetical protein
MPDCFSLERTILLAGFAFEARQQRALFRACACALL